MTYVVRVDGRYLCRRRLVRQEAATRYARPSNAATAALAYLGHADQALAEILKVLPRRGSGPFGRFRKRKIGEVRR